jgi:type IX secretion system PorP/SprF family membrane protein
MNKLLLYFNVKVLGLILALFIFGEVEAQQQSQFSMYMFNPLSVNPAYAGTKDALNANVLSRFQWVNLDGAPMTQTFSIHSPIRKKNIGVGFSVMNDKIGSTNHTAVTGDFSYRIKLNRQKDYLSFGLKGGVGVYNANFIDRDVQDATDVLYATPIQNKITPNIGFGVYYYGKKHYLGLTTPQLISNKINANTPGGASIESMHLYLIGGYVFEINSLVQFKPSMVAKFTPNAPLSMDLNASFFFYNKLWLGAMYRLQESVGLNMVFYINDYLKFGYAFDYSTTQIQKYSQGSHEIMLGFDLNAKKGQFYSPRYF